MSALADDLRAAKALIDTPEKWAATSLTQALRSALKGTAGRAFASRMRSMRGAIEEARKFHTSIEEWQMHPTTTHADIMALFDEAIAKAEGDAP